MKSKKRVRKKKGKQKKKMKSRTALAEGLMHTIKVKGTPDKGQLPSPLEKDRQPVVPRH